MFRDVVAPDLPHLLEMIHGVGLFDAGGMAEIATLLSAYAERNMDDRDAWIVEDDGAIRSVAYVAPERMTDRAWNLYLIAVDPNVRGAGRGSALLRYVEDRLAARGERLLVVETSGLEEFAKTRAFYKRNGYSEEARIREFYAAGEDKLVFTKALERQSS